MSEAARHEDPSGGVYGYVREREDRIRRDFEERLERALDPLHQRIGKRRDELQSFREADFATVGEQVGQLAHDLARGAQPGWVAMRIDALERALEESRTAGREYADAISAHVQREIESLREKELEPVEKALMAQRDTLTWFQRAVFGAMFVALTSLAVQVLLLTKGPG
jgi:hypothetical protein